MKRIFVFGMISLMLLTVILSGCEKNLAGQAIYVKTGDTKEGGAGVYFQTGANIQGLNAAQGGGLKFNLKNPTSGKWNGIILGGDGSLGIGVTPQEMTGIESLYVGGVIKAVDIFVTDGLDVDEITQLRGDTYLHSLKGEGNASLCIDNGGKIFRSNNPCR